MKKVLALALVLAMSIGCMAFASAEEPVFVGFSMKSQNIEFTATLVSTFEAEAAARGWKYTVTDANDNTSTQVSQIEDLVTQGVDYLVVCPVDGDALGGALQTAVDAGIPVINIDSAVCDADKSKVVCIVSSNNEQGGKALGEWLAEHIPENTAFGCINYPQVRAIDDRVQAMLAVLAEKRPDVTVYYKIATNFNNMVDYADDMIMAHSDISTLFTICDPYVPATMKIARNAGIVDPIVVGFDGSPAGKQAIRDGEQSATCVNSCVSISKATCQAIDKLIAGESVDFNISTDMWVIDKDNVEQYGYDAFN